MLKPLYQYDFAVRMRFRLYIDDHGSNKQLSEHLHRIEQQAIADGNKGEKLFLEFRSYGIKKDIESLCAQAEHDGEFGNMLAEYCSEHEGDLIITLE